MQKIELINDIEELIKVLEFFSACCEVHVRKAGNSKRMSIMNVQLMNEGSGIKSIEIVVR